MSLCKACLCLALILFAYPLHVFAQAAPATLPQAPVALMTLAHERTAWLAQVCSRYS